MVPVQTGITKPTKSPVQPRILVVDDEPYLIELIGDILRKSLRCQVYTAHTLEEARKVMATQGINLLMTDVHLPDGDGMSLLATLHDQQPCATAIIITGAPSLDGAIAAMREGALDFVPKPFSSEQLVSCVRKALDRHTRLAKDEERFQKLREAVKRLNTARKLITRKVDLLCNDLVSAYGELSRQLDGVRTQEGFRKYIAEAGDLEQLLCHAMDWLLRQLGYCNVGVWLAADEGDFQLGAYMKYTIAGDAKLTDAIKKGLLPQVVKDGLVHVPSDQLKGKLTAAELTPLKKQDLLAVNCTYLGEPLAALVFFRDAASPFTPEDEALVKAISPIFALALTQAVRPDAPTGIGEGEAGPFYDGDPADSDTALGDSDRREKKDEADWWKTGGEAPF
jgi:FixJ family two-component response regulator